MKQPVERRLAAILAADVAGYSRLMGEDEAGTAPALREHRAAAAPIVAHHGGRIVKTTGDGVLIEFGSVVGAVQCAVALQELVEQRNVVAPTNAEWSGASASILGTSWQKGRTSSATASASRRDWRASPSRVASAFPKTYSGKCAARSRPSLPISVSRASKHRPPAARLPHRPGSGARTAGSYAGRYAGRIAAPRQAVDCSAALRQYERRPRAGI